MTTSVVRMYETEQQARDAVNTLKEEGFPDDSIMLVTANMGSDDGMAGAIPTAILAGVELGSNAQAFADGVQNGKALLVVRAPFGCALEATNIMERYEPMNMGFEVTDLSDFAWDEAAPLSSMLHLKTLSRNSPAPFSESIGLTPLSHGRSALSGMFGELGSSHFTFSSLFGLGCKSKSAAPLSSMLGLPTKSGKVPMQSSMGMGLLSSDAAPLSSALGLPLLTGRR